eukprot:2118266-Pyramimonas_sp.AAC.1
MVLYAHHQHGVPLLGERPQQLRVARRVRCLHKDLHEVRGPRDLRRVDLLRPRGPMVGVHVEDVVVDGAARVVRVGVCRLFPKRRHVVRLVLQRDLVRQHPPQHLAEALAALHLVDDPAEGPHERVQQVALEHHAHLLLPTHGGGGLEDVELPLLHDGREQPEERRREV